jgi:peptide/nickel transport system permease protein
MATTQDPLYAPILLPAEHEGKRFKLSHYLFVWRQQPAGVFGAIVIVFLTAVAILAPLIAPHAANLFVGDGLKSPGPGHWFGLDNLGRDELSRTIYAAQISLAAGITATTIATFASTIFAMLSFFGGSIDNIVQRALEVLGSFPSLVLALVFIAIFGRSNATSKNLAVIAWQLRSLELAIGLTFLFGVTRVLRSAVIRERSLPYIEAARVTGVPTGRILWRHILPNIMAYVIISFSSLIGATILIEASLSFLGYGVAPGTPSWGADLSTRNRDYFWEAPWLLLTPGVSLSLLVMAYNFFGDALRDILDPRLRGS